jgi:hypothetical protein
MFTHATRHNPGKSGYPPKLLWVKGIYPPAATDPRPVVPEP